MRTRRAFVPVLTAILVFAIGGGVYTEIALDGHSSKPSMRARTSSPDKGTPGAHGLMLYPLADPNAHVRNGAEPAESTR
jgi:hypothetical protein